MNHFKIKLERTILYKIKTKKLENVFKKERFHIDAKFGGMHIIDKYHLNSRSVRQMFTHRLHIMLHEIPL